MSTIHEIDVAVDDDDSGAAALSSSNHNRKRSASQAGLLNSPATPRKKMKGDHRIAKFKFSPTPKKMKPVETSREAVSNELQAYLIEDFEGDMGSFFLNPLLYWLRDDTEAKYPHLSKIACHVLTIPASSAAVERLFSLAGLILNKKRSHTNIEKVSMLCKLKMRRRKYEPIE